MGGEWYPPPLTEKIRWVVFDRFPYILTYMPSKLPEDPSNLNILLTTTKKEMIYNIPVNTRWYPLIPVDTRNTRKYPKYPKIPESKRDTRKYPIAYFDTPTRPEPDPLPGILSNTRPDPTRPDIEKPYPLGTAHLDVVWGSNLAHLLCSFNFLPTSFDIGVSEALT